MSMSLRPAALPEFAAVRLSRRVPVAPLSSIRRPLSRGFGACCEKRKGGYCCGAPPLPIPNREVKPARADGTAKAGE